MVRGKLLEAETLASKGAVEPTVCERRIADRQVRIRRLYLAQTKLLQTSSDPGDRDLGVSVERFVRDLSPPDTERLALARRLRAAGKSRSNDRSSVERMWGR